MVIYTLYTTISDKVLSMEPTAAHALDFNSAYYK